VTTADSYLDATVHARVEILTGDRVDRIAVVGDRAVGVVLASGVEVPAHRVVVCAGAVGSPALLLASGLGGAAVGRNLQNHPGLPVTLHLRDGVDVDRHGLATAVTWRAETDVEIVALNHLGPDEPGRAMLLVGAMAPTGRGSVTLGADGTPVVEPVASDQDRVRLDVGLRRVEELLAHPAFAAIVDRVEVGQAPAGFHHATSTCAMGAVVDGRGSVTATAGLAVVDASVFPTIPTTHPYLPTVVLAETLGAIL
ncbi:MAG: GMC family oxidoreductase N-terminal domain-containing protein, partial [Acidimicrobiia bacterium]|nr:GMC family oxidoreductase N-terminal domain-containing protein [Acidimicrobiia bacterium]